MKNRSVEIPEIPPNLIKKVTEMFMNMKALISWLCLWCRLGGSRPPAGLRGVRGEDSQRHVRGRPGAAVRESREDLRVQIDDGVQRGEPWLCLRHVHRQVAHLPQFSLTLAFVFQVDADNVTVWGPTMFICVVHRHFESRHAEKYGLFFFFFLIGKSS